MIWKQNKGRNHHESPRAGLLRGDCPGLPHHLVSDRWAHPDRCRDRRGRPHPGRNAGHRPCISPHSHLDHIAALPLMPDAISSRRSSPVQVHALQETIAALQAHVFNNVIWPDFSRIPSGAAPFLQYQALDAGQRWKWRAPTWKCCPPAMRCPPWAACSARAPRLVGVQRRHGPQPRLLAAHQPDARVHAGNRNRLQQPRERPRRDRPAPCSPDAGTGTGPTRPGTAFSPSTSPTQSRPRRNSSWRRSAALMRVHPMDLLRRTIFGGCGLGMLDVRHVTKGIWATKCHVHVYFIMACYKYPVVQGVIGRTSRFIDVWRLA